VLRVTGQVASRIQYAPSCKGLVEEKGRPRKKDFLFLKILTFILKK